MTSERKKAAYAAVDAAIHELIAAAEEDDDVPNSDPETLTEWVIVTGSQYFDADGDRSGLVRLFPRFGSQPYYITAGLLHQGLSKYS